MLFLRSSLIIVFCNCALSHFGQVDIKGRWTPEFGMTTISAFREPSSLNIRYISPRFKWSDEWNEDEEKYPDKFRNTRMMVELIYGPPKKLICTAFNVQSRLLGTRRLSLNMYGGIKFFIITSQEYKAISYLKGGREFWYMSVGLICQLNLGVISPFVDLGGDGIMTVGTEVNLRKIYRKPKKRYKLKTKPG